MPYLLLTVGGLLTLGGAGLLVLAFRHGQHHRRDDERRTFRWAVACLAVGSLAFFGTVLTSGA